MNRITRRYYELGKGRAITQGFPFNNHRTQAQVIEDEYREKMKRIETKDFGEKSFG